MEEGRIKAYFERQVRVVIELSAAEPEGFLSYFAEHEPKDEEILGLLAITSMMAGDLHRSENFPTAVEALAAISPDSRSEICREFRRELKACLRHLTAA